MSVVAVPADALGGFGATVFALVALMMVLRSVYGLAGLAGGVAAAAVGLAMVL